MQSVEVFKQIFCEIWSDSRPQPVCNFRRKFLFSRSFVFPFSSVRSGYSTNVRVSTCCRIHYNCQLLETSFHFSFCEAVIQFLAPKLSWNEEKNRQITKMTLKLVENIAKWLPNRSFDESLQFSRDIFAAFELLVSVVVNQKVPFSDKKVE